MMVLIAPTCTDSGCNWRCVARRPAGGYAYDIDFAAVLFQGVFTGVTNAINLQVLP